MEDYPIMSMIAFTVYLFLFVVVPVCIFLVVLGKMAVVFIKLAGGRYSKYQLLLGRFDIVLALSKVELRRPLVSGVVLICFLEVAMRLAALRGCVIRWKFWGQRMLADHFK